MKTGTRILNRIAIAASMACVLLSSAGARSVKEKKHAARTQFETAERMREALDGRSESQRTRRDYKKVIDAYRKVYYTAPTSIKADAAVQRRHRPVGFSPPRISRQQISRGGAVHHRRDLSR